MNGNTFHDDPILNDPMMKLKLHLNRYQQEYIILGLGVAAGLSLGSIFRGKPKINEAAIVTKWMEETALKGFNIYALTNEQKNLWEESFGWAVKAANSMQVALPDVLLQMAKDYREAPIPVQGWSPTIA